MVMDEEELASIRKELQRAFQGKKMITVQSQGTYKGITGLVVYYGHGSIKIQSDTEDGTKVNTTLRVVDIRRVSVYE